MQVNSDGAEMKNFMKSNPMAFALIIVFLLLIVIGVVTSKAVERAPEQGPRATSGLHAVELAAPRA